jgi:2,4-dienoyl-CoA reductase (NADPH2)
MWWMPENKVKTGNTVAIIGGGAVGVETALFLAEKGTLPPDVLKFLLVNRAETLETLFNLATRGSKKIYLIEMMERVGKDIGKSTQWGMIQDLGRMGVHTITSGRVTKITPAGLEYEQEGGVKAVEADTVVMAAGSQSNNPLESLIKKLNIPCRVIGDAQKIGTAFDAVHDGYRAAREI